MTTTEIALAGYLAFGQLIPHGQQEIVERGFVARNQLGQVGYEVQFGI